MDEQKEVIHKDYTWGVGDNQVFLETEDRHAVDLVETMIKNWCAQVVLSLVMRIGVQYVIKCGLCIMDWIFGDVLKQVEVRGVDKHEAHFDEVRLEE